MQAFYPTVPKKKFPTISLPAGFLLGPGHRDLYSAILIFVPAIFTLSLY